MEERIYEVSSRIVAGMASAAAVYLYRLYARYGYKWKKAKKHFRASKLVCAVLTGAVLALLGPYWRYLNRVLYPFAARISFCFGWAAAQSTVVLIEKAIAKFNKKKKKR